MRLRADGAGKSERLEEDDGVGRPGVSEEGRQHAVLVDRRLYGRHGRDGVVGHWFAVQYRRGDFAERYRRWGRGAEGTEVSVGLDCFMYMYEDDASLAFIRGV